MDVVRTTMDKTGCKYRLLVVDFTKVHISFTIYVHQKPSLVFTNRIHYKKSHKFSENRKIFNFSEWKIFFYSRSTSWSNKICNTYVAAWFLFTPLLNMNQSGNMRKKRNLNTLVDISALLNKFTTLSFNTNVQIALFNHKTDEKRMQYETKRNETSMAVPFRCLRQWFGSWTYFRNTCRCRVRWFVLLVLFEKDPWIYLFISLYRRTESKAYFQFYIDQTQST